MFSGSFERLLSAARAKDVNAGDGFNMPSAFNEALQNENAAYHVFLRGTHTKLMPMHLS